MRTEKFSVFDFFSNRKFFTAGLVSNYIKPQEGKIGRITGLDPTIFVYAGSNNSRDLDPSDVSKFSLANELTIRSC